MKQNLFQMCAKDDIQDERTDIKSDYETEECGLAGAQDSFKSL